ncbi:D-alanine--D-alanine ligase [Mycobacterium xenopi 4042]|uniref:D-alanine--D-alanine ligase n=1 Tax=Mycobacterium xenopi 4042 TaxID=1299334 RepID=X8DBL0_MYCXE|nr:D-alanine--D-alanine ligase [Mycobacterium xenopi 4042]
MSARHRPASSGDAGSPTSQGRTRVAVVYGGRSNEHAISCMSAGSILRHLDRQRFDVVPVGITRDGSWVLTDARPETLAITDGRLPEVSAASGTALALAQDPRQRGQLVSVNTEGKLSAGEVLASVDVVFPVLHGPYGEDGTIQGLLELAGVPYVGAGVLASATAMDKEFTKKLLAADGLPVGAYEVLRSSQPTLTPEQRERLGLPVFVKPARGGSSIGVSRVTDWAQLPAAIDHARQHDPKVLVEAAVVGRELECGVLEIPDGTVQASSVGEIRLAGSVVAMTPFTTSRPSTSTTLRSSTCRPKLTTTSAMRYVIWRSGRFGLSTAKGWPGSISSSPTTGR